MGKCTLAGFLARQMDFFSQLLRPAPAEVQPPATPKPLPDLLETARDLLRSAGGPRLAERLIVRWNPRLRSTAGTALPSRCTVSLNPQLQRFGAEEIDRTLRHELAHLLAQHRAGRRRISPHGPEWRQACRDLGAPQETRCHNLPLPRRLLVRPYLYRCPHCRVELRRARPMRGRRACLACCRSHAGGRYDERFRFQPLGGR